MDTLFLEKYLPFEVDDEKERNDAEETERGVERGNGGEHRKDFPRVESPEDVDEKDDASDRQEFFPIHRCALGCMSLLVYVDSVSLERATNR